MPQLGRCDIDDTPSPIPSLPNDDDGMMQWRYALSLSCPHPQFTLPGLLPLDHHHEVRNLRDMQGESCN